MGYYLAAVFMGYFDVSVVQGWVVWGLTAVLYVNGSGRNLSPRLVHAMFIAPFNFSCPIIVISSGKQT